MIARFFDDADARPLASKIAEVTLEQASEPGARLGPEPALLLGWIATRLGWKTSRLGGTMRFERADGARVAIELGAVPRPRGVARRRSRARRRRGRRRRREDARLDRARARAAASASGHGTRRPTPTSSSGSTSVTRGGAPHRAARPARSRTRPRSGSSGRCTARRTIRRSTSPSRSPSRSSRTGSPSESERRHSVVTKVVPGAPHRDAGRGHGREGGLRAHRAIDPRGAPRSRHRARSRSRAAARRSMPIGCSRRRRSTGTRSTSTGSTSAPCRPTHERSNYGAGEEGASSTPAAIPRGERPPHARRGTRISADGRGRLRDGAPRHGQGEARRAARARPPRPRASATTGTPPRSFPASRRCHVTDRLVAAVPAAADREARLTLTVADARERAGGGRHRARQVEAPRARAHLGDERRRRRDARRASSAELPRLDHAGSSIAPRAACS